MSVTIARVYGWEKQPGQTAVLVDRLWPRGVKKDALGQDEWARHLAPSTGLRQWFNHEAEKWPEFRHRYRAELASHSAELLRLRRIADEGELVLLYSAHDTAHNQAVVLRELIESTSP